MDTIGLFVFYAVMLAIPSVAYPAIRRLLQRSKSSTTTTAAVMAVVSSQPVAPAATPAAKDHYPEGRFPGPKQYPFVGRVHDLPRFSMWLKFTEWANEFGPIYQTSMVGQKFVIVSDEEIATDLLVKNGNSFAGRPQIRALVDHKLGPVYSALMDRHGTLP